MNYKLVSGGEVIARIDTYFTIDFSDWITIAPLLILDGLLELNTPMVFIEEVVTLEVTEYSAELPTNVKGIALIMYNGKRLNHLDSIIKKTNDSPTNYIEPYYTHRGGNVITTSFEEGTIDVTIKSLPIELVPALGVSLPKVPDDINVFNALANYIMLKLLIKGYKHPTLSLEANNAWLNPGLAFERYSKMARNTLGTMSYDQRIELSNLQHEFVANYNYANNEGIGHLSGEIKTP